MQILVLVVVKTVMDNGTYKEDPNMNMHGLVLVLWLGLCRFVLGIWILPYVHLATQSIVTCANMGG